MIVSGMRFQRKQRKRTALGWIWLALTMIGTATTAQAQGELEYAENLFAIVWFEDRPLGVGKKTRELIQTPTLEEDGE